MQDTRRFARPNRLTRRSPIELPKSTVAGRDLIGGGTMRTTSLALAIWALLQLAGCASNTQNYVRTGPCAIETSMECQIERYSRMP